MARRGQHKGRGPKSQQHGGVGRVRIIAGAWRGSRLEVPTVAGLRPSSDRGREVLFSWLQPRLAGSRCLDLFAGSGVLGLEALSRGAEQVILIERDRQAAAGISAAIERLGAAGARLVRGDTIAWLRSPERAKAGPVDIVFVDPPFDENLWMPVLDGLLASGLLAPGALIHIESPSGAVVDLPPQLRVVKSRRVGQVELRLLQVETGPSGADG